MIVTFAVAERPPPMACTMAVPADEGAVSRGLCDDFDFRSAAIVSHVGGIPSMQEIT
ncbi:MAG: hypothetical protein M0009_16535 [Deltaproteobacteria bacterium]|nr:hypothetical protein [Deltaproteobacteria bacterium]